jgi:hypothetical protein
MGNGTSLLFDPCVLHTPNRLLLRGAENIALRPKTFATFDFLIRNPGRLVTKTDSAEKPSVHPSSTSGRTADRSKSSGIPFMLSLVEAFSGFLSRIKDRYQTTSAIDPGSVKRPQQLNAVEYQDDKSLRH